MGTETVEAVAHKIHEYEPTQALQQIQEYTLRILTNLHTKGLLKGEDINEQMVYDLSKITTPNNVRINLDLIGQNLQTPYFLHRNVV